MTVVVGAVVLVAGSRTPGWTIERLPFWRDSLMLLVAATAVLVIAADGSIDIYEALMFLGLHAVYIFIVLMQRRIVACARGAVHPADSRTAALPTGAISNERLLSPHPGMSLNPPHSGMSSVLPPLVVPGVINGRNGASIQAGSPRSAARGSEASGLEPLHLEPPAASPGPSAPRDGARAVGDADAARDGLGGGGRRACALHARGSKGEVLVLLLVGMSSITICVSFVLCTLQLCTMYPGAVLSSIHAPFRNFFLA